MYQTAELGPLPAYRLYVHLPVCRVSQCICLSVVSVCASVCLYFCLSVYQFLCQNRLLILMLLLDEL